MNGSQWEKKKMDIMSNLKKNNLNKNKMSKNILNWHWLPIISVVLAILIGLFLMLAEFNVLNIMEKILIKVAGYFLLGTGIIMLKDLIYPKKNKF